MLVDLTSGAGVVREADDLARLHVLAPVGLDVDTVLRGSGLGFEQADGRALLDVTALRGAARASATDPAWDEGWDAMVAYAASKGWVAAGGSALVAHVERSG